MAEHSKIKVMISSRCLDKFPPSSTRLLSDIRKVLKAELEGLEIFGEKILEVWINEDAPPAPGTVDSWEECLDNVKDCHALIVLYNGNAGWCKTGGDIGICHEEMSLGYSLAPGKVRTIQIDPIIAAPDPTSPNGRFQSYAGKKSPFYAKASTEPELIEITKRAVRSIIVNLAVLGVRESSRGKFHSGQALNWSSLSYGDRAREMKGTMKSALLGHTPASELNSNVVLTLDSKKVLFILHAIPDSFGVPQARETVGQTFLYDIGHLPDLATCFGPVHLTACHKSITESQAKKLLGHPDATVINAPFGIFVADPIQKIQFALIRDCRDDTTTRHGIQRFFAWLESNGEDVNLAKRAVSRTKILQALDAEKGI